MGQVARRLVLATALLVLAAPVNPAQGASGFLGAWGTLGSGEGQMKHPVAVGTDRAGNVYVADTDNDRIQKFTDTGQFITMWGFKGIEDPASIGSPESIAVDPQGNVYVLSRYAREVKKFSSTGDFLGRFGGSPVPADPSLPFTFTEYYSLAVDQVGNVYVASSTKSSTPSTEPALSPESGGAGPFKVRKFSPSGTLLEEWSRPFQGSKTVGRLTYGAPLAVDPDGFVYVVTDLGRRVEKLDPSGALVGQVGSPGRDEGELSSAYGIAADSSGSVYVVESAMGRVQRFSADGVFQGAWGALGKRPGRFIYPAGIATDPSGNVYVADTLNNRIQKFSPEAAGTPALGKTVNVKPVAGIVRFRPPGRRSRYTRLTESEAIPVGSLIDTRNGRVSIRSATDRRGGTREADFYGGIFRVLQQRRPGAVTEVRLAGRLLGCGRGGSASASRARKRPPGRLVWGDGKGRHRSTGRNSSASVRGTRWLVHDRCDGSTLTRVARGVVVVRDFARHRTVKLRKGQHYVARRKGRSG